VRAGLEPIPEPNSKFQTCRAENRDVQRQLLGWKSTITRACQNSVRVLIIKKLCGQQRSHKTARMPKFGLGIYVTPEYQWSKRKPTEKMQEAYILWRTDTQLSVQQQHSLLNRVLTEGRIP